MEKIIRNQRKAGVRALAINGATGEYTRSSREEVANLLDFLRPETAADVLILGVGGADLKQTQALIDLGQEVGVQGYLLPVPYYFPYEQQDILSFISSAQFALPTYLYNLPSFTTPIAPETALEIWRAKQHVVGIKDSSGSLDTVQLFSSLAKGAARIIGSDSALCSALKLKVCDGVVSGVAGVLPELMLRLYTEAVINPLSERSISLETALTEYISWLGKFPVPWGLKLTAEYRGLFQAEFPFPLSEERQASASGFVTWLNQNRDRLLIS